MTTADQGQLARARSSPEQPLCAQDPLAYFSLAERPVARARPTSTRPCRHRTAGPDRRASTVPAARGGLRGSSKREVGAGDATGAANWTTSRVGAMRAYLHQHPVAWLVPLSAAAVGAAFRAPG